MLFSLYLFGLMMLLCGGSALPHDYTETANKDATESSTLPQRQKRYMVKMSRMWPKGIIPYVFTKGLKDKVEIQRVMPFIEDQSCVRFVHWNKSTESVYGLGHPGHLKFYNGIGCHSFARGVHKSPNGAKVRCCSRYHCLHEIGHAMGFFHEQQSQNRDGWIRVNMQNVEKKGKIQYELVSWANDTFPYDISTIMHYADWAFKSNGPTYTMLFKDLRVTSNYFYFFMEIAYNYQCHEKPQCMGKILGCANDGYQTILHGKCQCKCPPGLDPDDLCKTPLWKVKTSTWPKGSYALPEADEGCPGTDVFKTGKLTSSGPGGNTVSDPYNLAGEVNGKAAELHFCAKTTKDDVFESEDEAKFNWPAGNFCIYRKGDKCPIGFTSRSIKFTSSSTPSVTGEVADGHFDKKMELVLCCQLRGFYESPGAFPVETPFAFIRHPNEKCQYVEGMSSKKESFTFSSSTKFEVDPLFKKWVSKDGKSIEVPLCYYTKVDMDCGEAITLSKANPKVTIEMNGRGRKDLECTWVIEGDNPNGTLLLDFEEFDLKKSGGSCDYDRIEVRHARIGQPADYFKSTECSDHKHRPFQTIRSIYDKILMRFQTMGDSESSFRAKVRWMPYEDMCDDVAEKGISYDGKVNISESFKPCLPWHEMTECPHNPFLEVNVRKNLDRNYCRNPDNSFRPWCYIDKKDCNREYCDVCGLDKPFDTLDECQDLVDSGICTRDAAKAAKYCAKTCYNYLPIRTTPMKISERITCSTPTVPSDGSALSELKTKYKLGDTVEFGCNKKTGKGKVTSRCMTSGSWSHFGSACDGGYSTCEDTLGEKCQSLLIDTPSLCTDHNEFVEKFCRKTCGICEADDEHSLGCQVQNKNPYVQTLLTDESISVGKFVDYRCDEFKYRISGDERRACLSRGQLTGEPLECGDCPIGFKMVNNACYGFLLDEPRGYEDARKECKKFDGFLAMPKTQEENAAINSIRANQEVWMGATDMNTDDKFLWDDGTSIIGWNNWKDGLLTECPENWHEFNDTCYSFIDSKMTFSQAVSKCDSLNAFIASPKNEEQHTFIQSIRKGYALWLGVTDIEKEKDFRWQDGTKLEWSNWDRGDPNNYGGYQDCAVMLSKGKWNDQICESTQKSKLNKVVCETPKIGKPKRTGSNRCTVMDKQGRWVNVNCFSKKSRYYTACSIPKSDSLLKCVDILGKTRCESLLTETPGLCVEHPKFVNQYCRKTCGICDAEGINCQVENPNTNDLIKSTDDPTISVGQFVEYSCIEYKYRIKGDKRRACLADGTLTGELLQCGDCPLGFKTLDKACYGVLTVRKLRYKDAIQQCKELNGFLAMPKTEEENNVIISVREGKTVWIGATDMNGKEQFQWDDGSDIDWTNWVKGVLSACPEGWTEFNQSCYHFIDTQMTFSQAASKCDSLDAFIASPKNEEQHRIIESLRERSPIWLGVTDIEKEGDFKWQDGSKLEWSNWYYEDPNNYGGNQNCAVMLPSKKWNDQICEPTSNSDLNRVVCQTPKIGKPKTSGAKRCTVMNKHGKWANVYCFSGSEYNTACTLPIIEKVRCDPLNNLPSDVVIEEGAKQSYRVDEIVKLVCKTSQWSVFSKCLPNGKWSEWEHPCLTKTV